MNNTKSQTHKGRTLEKALQKIHPNCTGITVKKCKGWWTVKETIPVY